MHYPDLKGIVTVLNTPFTDDDQIDYTALQRHASLAISEGVCGFLVPAMAAEVQSLRGTERVDMVRAVLDVSRGKAAVVGGASAATHLERCRNVEQLAELGCDVVLVSQPYETHDRFISDLKELAQVSDRALMVQDWDAGGSGVPLAAIVEAHNRIEAFQYIKVETLDAGPKYTAIKRATNGQLHVSGGWAVMQLIESLDRGVDAFMPTSMHRIYVTIYRIYQQGDCEAATDLFRKTLPILAFSNQHLEHSIHFFKRMMWRQGLYPTPRLRNPRHVFDDQHQATADELIALASGIERQIGG
ncbi:MAG: dihydrodipicolinate synthase family protein [Hyphomicrobiales bacterium]|nr:dihydrodipicolinate synthase family protein [Hyphomicrobiales bacterium]